MTTATRTRSTRPLKAGQPMRAQIEAMLEELECMPTGEQIYDLLLEDKIANFVWWRCVDWVLYRLHNGMPVQRMNDKDAVPAAINARFQAAQHTYRCGRRWPEPLNIGEVSNATTIDRWERTPEQAAALKAETDMLIKGLRAIGKA